MASPLLTLSPQHGLVIRTERLSMRAVRPDDLAAIHSMRLKPKVMEFMPGVETQQDALKSNSVVRIQLMMKENMFSFAMHLVGGGRKMEDGGLGPVIGFIGITSPPQVFYIFDDTYWGNGYATEALRTFLNTYWQTYPLGLAGVPHQTRDYLEAHVHEGNLGSERVLKKCGFVFSRLEKTQARGREVSSAVFQIFRPKQESWQQTKLSPD